MDNLVRGATPGDAFVFYCELLMPLWSLSVDLISIDAGHAGRNYDVGGNHACKYGFSRCLS
jgi:hypothetical protein